MLDRKVEGHVKGNEVDKVRTLSASEFELLPDVLNIFEIELYRLEAYSRYISVAACQRTVLPGKTGRAFITDRRVVTVWYK
jgi:hypothetical protein